MNFSPQYYSKIGVFIAVTIAIAFMGMYIRSRKTIMVTSNSQNLVELYFESFEGIVRGVLGEEYVQKFTPLAVTIFTTIFITNLVSLFGFTDGAFANPVYTFTWSIGMFLFWNAYGIYKIGIKKFLADFTKPYAFMLPLEIIGFFTKPISMGARLLGNITAGAILMTIYWSVANLVVTGNLFVGTIAAPIFIGAGSALGFYFNVFGPFIQALVFTYLTLVNLAMLIGPEDE